MKVFALPQIQVVESFFLLLDLVSQLTGVFGLLAAIPRLLNSVKNSRPGTGGIKLDVNFVD
jgi:hypothetical protein